MHIGLIGGIGPAATDYYYRRLISEFARKDAQLDLTIVHADTPTLLNNLNSNDVESQVSIYNDLTKRLSIAGADCVVVTSIAGHFCIDSFKQSSLLRVISIVDSVNAAVTQQRYSRLGILGTRTVMESRFYASLSTAEIILPRDDLVEQIHSAYVAIATSGQVTSDQRAIFDAACHWLMREANVDAILLGGTDLALVYQEGKTRFPVVDCAAIHVDTIVRTALSSPAVHH